MRRVGLLVLGALLAFPTVASAADPYVDAVRATPGLTAYYRLGEPGASETKDELGGPAATTNAFTGGVAGATDDLDRAWRGVPGRGGIQTGRAPDTLGPSFTFTAWVLPTYASSSTGQVLLADVGLSSTSAGVRGRSLVLRDGVLVATVLTEKNTAQAYAYGLSYGAWHHVALRVTREVVEVHIDGRAAGYAQLAGAAVPGDQLVTVGADGQGFAPWAGTIDEVAFFDQALDPARIDALYRAGDDGAAPHARFLRTPPAKARADAPFAFAADRGGVSYLCSADGYQATPCEDVYRPYGAEGKHTLVVKAVSRYGVAEPDGLSYTWEVDQLPPPTLLAMKTAPAGGTATATFASEAGATFECSTRTDAAYQSGAGTDASGAGWAPCTSPLSLPAADDVTLSVRAVDAAGNRDAQPAYATTTLPYLRRGSSVTGAGAILTFKGEDLYGVRGGPKYTCAVDEQPFAVCRDRVELPVLAPGPHVFRVRLGDVPRVGTLETPPLRWEDGPRTGPLELLAVQFPLIIERSARLVRRVPRLRFTLTRAAPVTVQVVRRGGRREGRPITYAGTLGPNVVVVPKRVLLRLRPGRHALDLRAEGARERVPFAVVRARR